MLGYRVGRVLQLAGMLVLPFAIVSELMGRVTLGQAMLVALGGAVMFWLGTRLLPPR